MSKGCWTEVWDDTRKEWVSMYWEVGEAAQRGSVYTLFESKPDKPVLLGPDGRAIKTPEPEQRRPMGFRKP